MLRARQGWLVAVACPASRLRAGGPHPLRTGPVQPEDSPVAPLRRSVARRCRLVVAPDVRCGVEKERPLLGSTTTAVEGFAQGVLCWWGPCSAPSSGAAREGRFRVGEPGLKTRREVRGKRGGVRRPVACPVGCASGRRGGQTRNVTAVPSPGRPDRSATCRAACRRSPNSFARRPSGRHIRCRSLAGTS